MELEDEIPRDHGEYKPAIRGGGAHNLTLYHVPKSFGYPEVKRRWSTLGTLSYIGARPTCLKLPMLECPIGDAANERSSNRLRILRVDIRITYRWDNRSHLRELDPATGVATPSPFVYLGVCSALWIDQQPIMLASEATSTREIWRWQEKSADTAWSRATSTTEILYPTLGIVENQQTYDVLAYEGHKPLTEDRTQVQSTWTPATPLVFWYVEEPMVFKTSVFSIDGGNLPIVSYAADKAWPANMVLRMDTWREFSYASLQEIEPWYSVDQEFYYVEE